MKSILTNNHKKKSSRVLYSTHFDVWMLGLDHFKMDTKETGGNRNVVPSENATNLMDCKEIKRNSVRRTKISIFLSFRVAVSQVVRHISFGHNKLPFNDNKHERDTPSALLMTHKKCTTCVANFLPSTVFSIHKNRETVFLSKSRPEINAFPL